MTEQQWDVFSSFRSEFKAQCKVWVERLPGLMQLQKDAAVAAGNPDYSFENPVVYNTDLDRITREDDIRLIVIGDNPGKDEQLSKNCKYLVGQAGKIAEGYFRRNAELGVDFRKNVIILNKTPIHSAKTNQLKKMVKDGGAAFADLLEESQVWMAQKTAWLHEGLNKAAGGASAVAGCESAVAGGPELWLVGYSELKDKAIFTGYRDALRAAYENGGITKSAWEKVYVFQHFSMNRFSIDLDAYIKKEGLEKEPLVKSIHQLGELHKKEIFTL